MGRISLAAVFAFGLAALSPALADDTQLYQTGWAIGPSAEGFGGTSITDPQNQTDSDWAPLANPTPQFDTDRPIDLPKGFDFLIYSHTIDSTPESVFEFWTPRRMRDARPLTPVVTLTPVSTLTPFKK